MKKKLSKKTLFITILILALIGVVLVYKLPSLLNGISYSFTEDSLKKDKNITLEYSNEVIDPSEYVEVQKGTVTSSPETIDLSIVGSTTVEYHFSSDDMNHTEEVVCEFEVKDTQAPTITIFNETVETNSIENYDPTLNIESVSDPVDGSLPKVDGEPTQLQASEVGKIYETGWYTVTKNNDKVTIKAVDNHGNTTEKEFSITLGNSSEEVNELTSIWYYPSVDLNDGSAWVQLDEGFYWYYSECTYLSDKYQSIQEAIDDVVTYRKDKTGDESEDNIRIFKEMDENGNDLYYQAGYEDF